MAEALAGRPRAGVAFGWRVLDRVIALRDRLRADRLGAARPYLMLVPAMALVLLLAIGLLYLLWASFHGFDAFLLKQGPFSFEQYRRLVEPPSGAFYRQVIIRTVVISVTVTGVSVVGSLPIAYFIVRTRSNAARAAGLLFLLVPFLMGEIVRSFGWSLILGKRGALAWLASLVGASSNGILGTTWAVWFGMLQVSIPLATLLVLPAVRRIHPDMERAAETLGARPSRVWWHVIIPLARPGLVAGASIALLLNLAEYDMPQILGLGRLPFTANIIQQIYSLQNNMNFGAALSWILIVVATVTVLALAALGLRAPGSSTSTGRADG